MILKNYLTELCSKITYREWCEEDGIADILVKAPDGISYWSANPSNKPYVGFPNGFSQYGTYIIFKGCAYRVLFYISVFGETAVWGTNNQAWKILS